MISKRQWHVRDKWNRHLGLIGHQGLSRHIPPTCLLSEGSLTNFLGRNKIVFVKPVYGSFGNNIMKITRGKHAYFVHRENRVQSVAPNKIPGTVFRYVGRRRYLIQKGIPMLKVNGRPIDFRVLLLKPGERGEVMGIMGKMATGNRIVTNYNHGGRAIGFKELLRLAGWSQGEINHARTRMHRLGLTAAHKFNQRYKHCRRLGIDLALDENKQIWILEVNTNPLYELFKHHGDKNLYGKIDHYMKRIKKWQSNH